MVDAAFLSMKWKANKVLNTDSVFDWWNKSDPYLKFLKVREDSSCVLAAQTEVIPNNLNPSWKNIEIPLTKLATGQDKNFKIECWDQEPEGKNHQFIGEKFLKAVDLSPGRSYELFNSKQKAPGVLVLESFSVVNKPSFFDYLRGGLQLNLMVAIDFTGSNGSPNAPTSLHFYTPHTLNHYQMALKEIGDTLLNYDSDKCIPAFGFGSQTQVPQSHREGSQSLFPPQWRLLQCVGQEHEPPGDHVLQCYQEYLVRRPPPTSILCSSKPSESPKNPETKAPAPTRSS